MKNKHLHKIIINLVKYYFYKILDQVNYTIIRKKIDKYYASRSRFNSITINTENYLSELCIIGGNFGTDKSILNKQTGYQHSYTGIYHLLFSHLRDNNINVAEIGILNNASIRTFRNYFKYAEIDGFDYDEKNIENAKKFNLSKTNYYKIDVKNPESIKTAFESTKKSYDIILDDSTHIFKDQINIIFNTRKFLKKGGYLIIEDIFTKKSEYDETNYYKELKKIKNEFKDIFFVKCNNKFNYSGLWFNHKLLCLRK